MQFPAPRIARTEIARGGNGGGPPRTVEPFSSYLHRDRVGHGATRQIIFPYPMPLSRTRSPLSAFLPASYFAPRDFHGVLCPADPSVNGPPWVTASGPRGNKKSPQIGVRAALLRGGAGPDPGGSLMFGGMIFLGRPRPGIALSSFSPSLSVVLGGAGGLTALGDGACAGRVSSGAGGSYPRWPEVNRD